MPFLEVRTKKNSVFITEKATFSMVTEKPITIIESLKENASSAIYFIWAFENYKKGDFCSAISFFKATKDYENDSSILFYIGNCYSFNNNLNESVRHYDKAIEINPHLDSMVWDNKGIALSKLGRYEEAIEAYDKAIDIDPQYADAWSNKGLALDKWGKHEEAKEAFEKAHEMDPSIGIP